MPYFDFLGVLSPFVLAVSKSFSTFKLAVVAVLFKVFPPVYPRAELGLGVAHPVGFLVFPFGLRSDVFDFAWFLTLFFQR